MATLRPIPKRTRLPSTTVGDPIARFLLEQVDGRRDVPALAEVTFLAVDDAQAIVEGLVASGHLVVRDPNAEDDPLSSQHKLRIESILTELDRATHYELLGVPATADKAALKKAYFLLSKAFHPDTQFGKQIGEYRGKMEKVFHRLTEAHDVLTRPKRRDAYDAELRARGREPFVLRLHPSDEEPARPVVARPPSSIEARRPTATPAGPPSSVEMGRPSIAPGAGLRAPNLSSARPVSVSSARPVSVNAARPATSPAGSPPGAASPGALPNPPSTEVGRPNAAPAPVVNQPGLRAPSVHAPRPPSVHVARPASPAAPSPIPEARPTAPVASTPADSARASVPDPRAAAVRSAYAERLAMGLARQVGQTLDKPRPASSASPLPPRPDGQPGDEKSLLRALHASAQLTGPVDRVAQNVRRAASLEAQGDLAGAAASLRLAQQIDPNHAEVRAKLEVIERTLLRGQSGPNRRKAAEQERSGKLAEAAVTWELVARGEPEDAGAHLAVARCLLGAHGDLRKARDFAQQAVTLAPRDVEARAQLARIFAAAGMRLNALRELEAAAKFSPDHPIVKNLAKELR